MFLGGSSIREIGNGIYGFYPTALVPGQTLFYAIPNWGISKSFPTPGPPLPNPPYSPTVYHQAVQGYPEWTVGTYTEPETIGAYNADFTKGHETGKAQIDISGPDINKIITYDKNNAAINKHKLYDSAGVTSTTFPYRKTYEEPFKVIGHSRIAVSFL